MDEQGGAPIGEQTTTLLVTIWKRLREYSSYIILLGLVGVMAALVSLTWLGELNVFGQVLLIVGLALVVLYIVLEPQLARRAVAARQMRYGLNALVMSFAFVGILFLVNVALYKYNVRNDFTAGQEYTYTLSPQTIKIMGNLNQPVRITAFMQEDEQLKGLLTEYTKHTPSGKLTYEFVDPEQRPGLAQQYGITRIGTLVVESGEKRQDVTGTGEQDITGAILKVTRTETKRIYALMGHGEAGFDDQSDVGYNTAKIALENSNYQVITLNLPVSGTIPADAGLVILVSPRIPLGEKEIPAVLSYLNNGGKLFVLLQPDQTTGLEKGLLQEYGVAFENDIVVDPGLAFQGEPLAPAMVKFPFSQITKDLQLTFFPLARSVTQTASLPTGVTVQPLLQTSDRSWGETDFNSQPQFDAGQDIKGPLLMGLTAEKTASATGGGNSRLVLMGNVSFANNMYFGVYNNGDLFVNCANWLTEEEELISIRPKTPVENRMDLLPGQVPPIIFSSVCMLPLLVLGVGALVWWRRR